MTISIITITFNDPALQETLDSISSQSLDRRKFEHIIIDNFSTDNTEKIVKKYQKSSKYSVIYIREKDNGRYQAMNKGIKASKGDYLLFLNAGDCLHDKNVLSEATGKLDRDIVYGDILGKSLSQFRINKEFFIDRTLFHQATFIKRDLFHKYGLYDENLVISSDFDFFIKAIIVNHATTKYLPIVVSDYDQTGISSQKSDLVYQERALVLSRYTTGKIKIYHILKYIYYRSKKYLPVFLIKIQQKRLNSQPKI